MNNECFFIDLNYDNKDLYEYYKTLNSNLLDDEPAQYIEVHKANLGFKFQGNTIRHFKNFLSKKLNREVLFRPDLVSNVDKNHPAVSFITKQLHDLGFKTGLTNFFFQHKNSNVPLHTDYPYRKNSLVMIPIFFKEFKPTSAITFYENGGSYKILKPCVLNTEPLHGVENIDGDRLMLHIELPETPFQHIQEKFNA